MTTVLKLIDDKIRRAFSDSAVRYDVLTGLHKEIGRELLAKVAEQEGKGPILDVGIGTGWFTGRLKNHFPDARVVGIDFAAGMVDAAKMKEKDFGIVQADARRMPFKKNIFELIASNLAYQWVGDLPQAFVHCHEILKEDGKLNLTMLGYSTFRELFESLERTRDTAKGNIALPRLADRGQVSDALAKAGFRGVNVEEEHIKVHFPDMLALVKWVKDIGANALVGDMFIGRDWLNRADAYYHQTFGDPWGVGATLEVIWVEAQK
ncbi:MAG: methyltransferase domain-containing protein [Candidatus Omnitrophica bacterium]|nr:methyltransferase domain-containing protein [Candidatus Omnitrophota bacterium]